MTLDRGAAASERVRELGNEAFRASKFAAATRWYSAGLAVHPDAAAADRARLLCNRAMARFSARDYGSAVLDARAATQLDPVNAKAWFRLGRALALAPQLPEATPHAIVAAFDEAHRLAPSDRDIAAARTDARAKWSAKLAERAADRDPPGEVVLGHFVD
eukprot:4845594-Prymnesium_polylepis.1